jgi:hypothetical protein
VLYVRDRYNVCYEFKVAYIYIHQIPIQAIFQAIGLKREKVRDESKQIVRLSQGYDIDPIVVSMIDNHQNHTKRTVLIIMYIYAITCY